MSYLCRSHDVRTQDQNRSWMKLHELSSPPFIHFPFAPCNCSVSVYHSPARSRIGEAAARKQHERRPPPPPPPRAHGEERRVGSGVLEKWAIFNWRLYTTKQAKEPVGGWRGGLQLGGREVSDGPQASASLPRNSISAQHLAMCKVLEKSICFIFFFKEE